MATPQPQRDARREPTGQEPFGAWNPGLSSTLPTTFLPLATMFRSENVSTTLAQAQELASFTGHAPQEWVVFRPERLAIHELLVRVTAELSVPDGQKYADLGINFRRILTAILESDVSPHMDEIVRAHQELELGIGPILVEELANAFAPPTLNASEPGPGIWRRWFGVRAESPAQRAGPSQSSLEKDLALLASWRTRAIGEPDHNCRLVLHALARAASIVMSKHGRIVRDTRLMADLARTLILNEEGSIRVGNALDPHFRAGVARHGYRLLAVQPSPIVMNTKGASASGKSTMRPLQRQLAGRLGVDWASSR